MTMMMRLVAVTNKLFPTTTTKGILLRPQQQCLVLSAVSSSQRLLSSSSSSTTTAAAAALKKVTPKKLDFTKSPVDYVVVGAGSAGCVVASRLAEGNQRVHLIESGSSDLIKDSPLNLLLHIPTALAMPMHYNKYNWKYVIEPSKHLNNRIIHCPRGKGLGGSSSINGMVYVRGHHMDFDLWDTKYGATGWNYSNVLPYFMKAENWEGYNTNDGGEDKETMSTYRGKFGPLHVKNGVNACNTPLYDAFIQAGVEAGYGYTSDYNGSRQEGFSRKAMTVYHSGNKKGQRCSTSSAYLHPAVVKHPNLLSVETNSNIQRIMWDFEISDGRNNKKDDTTKKPPRAVGIEYIDKSGTLQRLPVNKEVILCAGAIESPHILQVSGVGNPSHLQQIHQDVVVNNPNVGMNLQDHLELYFQQEVLKPISMTPIVTSNLRKLWVGIEWLLGRRNGLASTNHFESAAFVRSSPQMTYPDIQFHFLPVAVSYDGQSITPSNSGHSMQIHIGCNRPYSRGHVLAQSSNMKNSPEIQFNYMSHEQEWIDFKKAIEIARQVMRQPALKEYVGEELLPGSGCADLDDYISEHIESAYHPCCTCKMGEDVEKDNAVVDTQGRVHGTHALRVVDASIFPSITNGNLNAPTIMVAERISDMILGKELLPSIEFTADNKPWEIPNPNMDREKEPIVQ